MRSTAEAGAAAPHERPHGSPVTSPGITAESGPEGPVDAAPPAADPLPSELQVLVLDDEPSIRRLLARALRDGGFEPVLAADGPEAIRLCEDRSIDAVLVDDRMPGMSGTEAHDAILVARPELAGRVVFMSGDLLNPELAEFAKATYITLLAKPFDIDAVVRVVGEVGRVAAGQRG